ncbi:NUDIX domain-containing protein [Dethiothermospora halolimnae]|uniref:NUDIX domain-containing protein n=1 Tax=Dethiothermospora halolimnae TaxID=3114390 RepID=UPI003CCB9389
MIKLRTMTTAYLVNNKDILLMKRALNRKFAPGVWVGVGGHVEPDEINEPKEACLREIFEETGISRKDIKDFKLKYIILRKSKDEIRLQYVYFGISEKREFLDTDEGKLFWVNKKELFNRELSTTTRYLLEHYIDYGNSFKDVLVGTVKCESNKPVMNWCPVQDWEEI